MNEAVLPKRARAARPLVIVGFILCLVSCLSGAAWALELGPKTLPLEIAGITIQIPASASLQISDALQFHGEVIGDLRSLQQRALDIARHLPLPHEPCAHSGVSLSVDEIDRARIIPSGKSVRLDLAGRVSAWACGKILGIRAKTKLGSDNVALSIPLELVVVNEHEIGVRLAGTAQIGAGHLLTGEAADVFRRSLDDGLDAALDKLLDTSAARAKLPPLPGLDLAIEEASFVQDGAALKVRARGHGTLPGAALAALLGFLAK